MTVLDSIISRAPKSCRVVFPHDHSDLRRHRVMTGAENAILVYASFIGISSG